MHLVSTSLAGILLGGIIAPGVVVHAQVPSTHSVVLVAPSDLSTSERGALTTLIDDLGSGLTQDDRLGVVLYSDIVEHVSELSVPTPEETSDEIERLLDALPAVDSQNGAIGIDRAIELLSSTRSQKAIIVIGELDIQLEDPVLTGRYSRWLDGTLMPTIDSEDIGLMAVTDANGRATLLARYGSETFAHIGVLDMEPTSLSALALEHVRTSASVNLANRPTTDQSSVAVADATISLPSSSTSAKAPEASSPTNPLKDPLANTSANTSVNTSANRLPDQTAKSSTDASMDQSPGASTELADRFASLSLAPLFILGVVIAALLGAGAYRLFGHRRRLMPKRGKPRTSPREYARTEPASRSTLMQPLAATLPGFGGADDATLRHTQSRQAHSSATWNSQPNAPQTRAADDDSRFDALVDSISQPRPPDQSDYGTVRTRARPVDSGDETLPGLGHGRSEEAAASLQTVTDRPDSVPASDAGIPTTGARQLEAGTVDTRRRRTPNTADLTRELEDLTKARNAQYDFE